jgi:hypothetical protein
MMGVLAIVLVVFLLVIGPVVVVNRDLIFHRSAAKRRQIEEPLPFLIIPSSPEAGRIHPAFVQHTAATIASPAQPQRATTPEVHVFPEAVPLPRRTVRQPEIEEEVDEEDEIASGATIVFTRPVDEPLQILPGRLVIISGEGTGEDLRLFSRIGEPPRIVVGRDTGPPHQHITLHSPTVSRRHARMDFDNGQWSITNLSETNPVLVNDRVLNRGSAARKLADGDRIELGEVELRFRAS